MGRLEVLDGKKKRSERRDRREEVGMLGREDVAEP